MKLCKMIKVAFLSLIILTRIQLPHVHGQDEQIDIVQLKGPYLGQKPPGLIPEIFAPTILSRDITTERPAYNSIFSPDGTEFYYTDDGKSSIMWMHIENGVWTQPEIAPFSSSFSENDLAISTDGNTAFFRSWRPLGNSDEPEERSYLWFSKRESAGWSQARLLLIDNGPIRTGYPSITKRGTLYFPYRDGQTIGGPDIFSSEKVDGKFTAPVSLGSTINTRYSEGDLYVDPNESFLIVSCWGRPDNNGESDLYISLRNKDGAWGTLTNMGEKINSSGNENCPTISPDGKYFFYARYDPKEEVFNTYWVEAEVIDRFKQ